MAEWITWLIMAGALVILELFTGTFYLLMIAIGMAAGALVAVLAGPLWLQLLAAAVVGSLATMALRRSRDGGSRPVDAAHDPNINLDIGQKVTVAKWTETAGSVPTARIMYRGAQWDVELAEGNIAIPGTFTIVEMRGSRLVLSSPSRENPVHGMSSRTNNN